jgi:hypothetical protein
MVGLHLTSVLNKCNECGIFINSLFQFKIDYEIFLLDKMVLLGVFLTPISTYIAFGTQKYFARDIL